MVVLIPKVNHLLKRFISVHHADIFDVEVFQSESYYRFVKGYNIVSFFVGILLFFYFIYLGLISLQFHRLLFSMIPLILFPILTRVFNKVHQRMIEEPKTMGRNQIIGVFGLCIAIILTLVLLIFFTGQDHIEDMNGEDTALVTINLGVSVKKQNHYRSYLVSVINSGNGSGVVGEYEDVDYDGVKFKAKKQSGVMTLHATKVNNNSTLHLTIKSILNSGNLEIVIVDPTNEIVETVPINKEESVTITNTIEGLYRVVIGGESADVNIEVKRR